MSTHRSPTPRGRWLVLLALSLSLAARGARAQQIAFTMDDLPAHSSLPPGVTRTDVAHDVLKAFKDAGLPPVYGFVNAVDLEKHPEDAAVLDAWRAAGNPLGNHTWSHLNLNSHTAEEFEAEVLKNEPAIRDRMTGQTGINDWHWLRYPNLAEGNTPEKRDAVRAFLAAHGYRIAGVTMSFADYSYNDPYARCMAKGNKDDIEKMEMAWLDGARDEVAFRRAQARALFGHDIPYVLLMHIGAFDAKMLPRLFALYKSLGIQMVSLQQAEADPFYANDLDPKLSATPDTLDQAMAAKGLTSPPRPKPEVDLQTICR